MKERKMLKSRQPKTTKRTRYTRKSTLNGHWDQWIEPKGVAYLTQTFQPYHAIIKNHGPAYVRLYALRGDDMHLPPGKVRGTFFQENLRVENLSATKPALIEFEFVPLSADFGEA
jgi:hypothetical protein